MIPDIGNKSMPSHHKFLKFLPLFFLSVSVIFLYSYYHSELPLFLPRTWNSNGDPHTELHRTNIQSPRFLNPRHPNCSGTSLSVPIISTTSPENPNSGNTTKNPNSLNPNFHFIIKVLTFDRLASLTRCLYSIAHADYADEFQWKHGEKMVHYRTQNVGLQAQWLESWWPASDDEFVFIVEDDLELSPLFYKYLKTLIANYYYDRSNSSELIYGASLQRPRFVAGKHGNKLQLDNQTNVFLYQMVGTWGQLLFPKPWKQFRLWYDTQKTMGIKPILEGMVTTNWYKKKGERIWTPWFIKFLHSFGYFNLYTNISLERALSVSHRDAGVNYGRSAGPDSSLINGSSPLDINLLEMKPLKDLEWFDFCFGEVVMGRVAKNFNELGSLLLSLQKQGTVIVVDLYRISKANAMNLLCHFERLNIRNYVLLGDGSGFLYDLANRGHPVVDSELLVLEIRAFDPMKMQGVNSDFMKEILIKNHVINKCLESGLGAWLITANMVPIENMFSNMTYQREDIVLVKDTELLFFRNSETMVKAWSSSERKMVEMAQSLVSKGEPVGEERERAFVYIATKILRNIGITIEERDSTGFGVRIGGDVNKTENGTRKRVVFWSDGLDLGLVRDNLESMDLWGIDRDLACKAVVCHHL
ncbi:hypothetical protein AMTR_s00063p00142620 [Amborella trichopoda]|uniref:Glycosyl transferase 64 domain-containing protein n=1 Tax=Amborella trichopoda TaxID=13333 RepID=U5D1E2_AMBTC|nr:hypothetical protein AMTR_s00063p00142620 [Amborella trichopoda]